MTTAAHATGMWGVLPDVLDRACTYYAGRTAILDAADGRSLTYRQLNHWRNRIANGLIKSGVEKGERVGLLMPNCLEFIPAQHGIWAAGASLVQMATRSAPEGFKANLAQTGATALISVDHSLVSNNVYGYYALSPGATIESSGNNTIRNNSNTAGSLTPAGQQ